jgi:hypothetical protein
MLSLARQSEGANQEIEHGGMWVIHFPEEWQDKFGYLLSDYALAIKFPITVSSIALRFQTIPS